MKGMSEMIAAVVIILIGLGMAAIVGPWALNLATESSSDSGQAMNQNIICQQTGYTFDSDYGVSGVDWNITGTIGTMTVKITNTKIQNLYNFTIEATFLTSGGQKILTEPDITIIPIAQKTVTNPLKPGQSTILDADIMNANDTWTLMRVKVLNAVCPSISPFVDI